jgi:hypothetical protein
MRKLSKLSAILALAAATMAQAQSADISAANADLAPVTPGASPTAPEAAAPAPTEMSAPAPAPAPAPATPETPAAPASAPAAPAPAPATAGATPTYHQQDILAAAEDTFGKGAEGLAKMIERLFKERGAPSGYIVGREAGAALLLGVRYGSGTLFHKVEGNLPVYWTGPSFGIDLGANGSKSFMLVYDLDDSEDLYKRYPGAQGSAYVVGGFTASHHRVGKVVVVPIHLGMGWRLGANVGYLKFSKTSQASPF